jgi:hypothetical protein
MIASFLVVRRRYESFVRVVLRIRLEFWEAVKRETGYRLFGFARRVAPSIVLPTHSSRWVGGKGAG